MNAQVRTESEKVERGNERGEGRQIDSGRVNNLPLGAAHFRFILFNLIKLCDQCEPHWNKIKLLDLLERERWGETQGKGE